MRSVSDGTVIGHLDRNAHWGKRGDVVDRQKKEERGESPQKRKEEKEKIILKEGLMSQQTIIQGGI